MNTITSKLGPFTPSEDIDDLNPEFLFSGTNNELLAAICNGQVDPYELAAKTLASRGFDVNGNWINFDAAKKYDYFQNQNK